MQLEITEFYDTKEYTCVIKQSTLFTRYIHSLFLPLLLFNFPSSNLRRCSFILGKLLEIAR